MKKSFLIIFISAILFSSLNGQNTYDSYIDFGVPSSLTFSAITTGTSYEGEYQLYIRTLSGSSVGITMDGSNHWSTIAKSDFSEALPYTFSYKTEVVSFPFAPFLAASGSTNRVLHSYGISDYNSTTDLWNNRVEREKKGVSTPIGGGTAAGKSINGPSNIISTEFHNVGGAPGLPSDRILFPHSILKHTIYLYCNGSAFGKPIDSLQFIIDHTRGNMRRYPFFNTNYTGGPVPSQYDILFASTLYNNKFNATSNEDKQWSPYYDQSGATSPPFPSTINYFPYPYGTNSCQFPGVKYYPTAEDFFAGIPDPVNFIHPPPYSLSGYELLNCIGDSPAGYGPGNTIIPEGIQHQYVIDQPIDLTIINPSQKVIYNPSETNIDLNNTLIFPSGYVFKTVDGIYPTQTQVYDADPDRLYNDPREIPTPTTLSYDDPSTTIDERKSYYYIKNGSILKIESCVGIYDAIIVVENGGTLIYDPAQTYGNYSIVQNAGSTVTIVSLLGGNCAHDCYDINKYDAKDITISTNTNWTTSSSPDVIIDGIIRIGGTLRVLANNTLTIGPGMVLEFGENAEIIVDKGGKLIANGTISNPIEISSATICKKGMWNGIQVKGDLSLSQTTTNQGQVLLNHVKISNARGAISSSEGGIVQCQNVEFKNNRVSAGFGSYHNKPTPTATVEYNNVSYFKNCQFLTTALLNDPIYQKADGRPFTVAHITMWDVKNVTIESCIFENSALKSDGITPLFDNDLRGAGIFSYDSGIKLSGGSVQNQFKGLSDGVWAISTGQTDMVWIEGTSFKNNVHGLTLEATQFSSINLDTFEIPAHEINNALFDESLQKGYNKPVGLYLIGATNFTVQENTFTNFGMLTTATTTGEYNYGMVIKNCSGTSTPGANDGSGLGYAYKNTFNNANVNLQAELDNRAFFDLSSSLTSGGLEYKCNNFNSRVNFDVTIPDGVPGSGLTSLIRDQGFCVTALTQAGNSYTSCTGSQQLDFGLSSLGVNGAFKYRDQQAPPSGIGTLSCASDLTSINNCLSTLGLNSCPSNFSLCATIPCLTTYYENALFDAEQALLSFQQLLDGGNTSSLTKAISSSMTPGDLKNLLISKSPYLSDEVLIATLNREDLPPYGHLEQIFIANSPIAQPVLSELESKGLPSGILNNILASQSGISARAEKEKEVDYYSFQSNLAEVNLIQGFLKIDNPDSLRAIAAKDSSLIGLFKLIKILIDKGYYADAHNCLSKIHVKEGSTHSDQCKLNGIRLYLAENNLTWFDMTPAQLATIFQIYQNNPETAIEARAILSLTKGLEYANYPYDVQEVRSMGASNPEVFEETKILSALKVYPNPSTDYTKVEIRLNEKIVNVKLIVYNLLGSVITEQSVVNNETYIINTKEYNNGIYFFVLLTEAGVIEKEKIIISK